mmetsp:Transcript_48355/g.87429  ORF Transcript_48355/g.87429 Transcript_48355/m.87429 type:complete len:210 (+) Transcript_48355:366-995(+)
MAARGRRRFRSNSARLANNNAPAPPLITASVYNSKARRSWPFSNAFAAARFAFSQASISASVGSRSRQGGIGGKSSASSRNRSGSSSSESATSKAGPGSTFSSSSCDATRLASSSPSERSIMTDSANGFAGRRTFGHVNTYSLKNPRSGLCINAGSCWSLSTAAANLASSSGSILGPAAQRGLLRTRPDCDGVTAAGMCEGPSANTPST